MAHSSTPTSKPPRSKSARSKEGRSSGHDTTDTPRENRASAPRHSLPCPLMFRTRDVPDTGTQAVTSWFGADPGLGCKFICPRPVLVRKCTELRLQGVFQTGHSPGHPGHAFQQGREGTGHGGLTGAPVGRWAWQAHSAAASKSSPKGRDGWAAVWWALRSAPASSVAGKRRIQRATCRWPHHAKHGWLQKFLSERGDLVMVQFASRKGCFKMWFMTTSKMAEVGRQEWKGDPDRKLALSPQPSFASGAGAPRDAGLSPLQVIGGGSPGPFTG